jgi:2'-5' RNA ligase
MRLFAAVDPPASERAALDAVLGGRDPGLRWVPPDQWHVTLAFYGEVAEARVADLAARLARTAARTSPFAVRLSGAGTFPAGADRARQVWVGVDGDLDMLARLAASCVAAGRRIGVRTEERRYRAHLTVARARRGSADVRDLITPLAAYSGAAWEVGEVRLVHSTIGSGVTHRDLAVLPVGDPRGED